VIRHVVVASTIGLLGFGPMASPAGSAVTLVPHRPILALDANQSSNWSGYNQGSQEQGGKLFNGVAGGWIVPRATQHKPGEAEFSSSWIGIGGGCVDANCTITDATLIQTGTEQDVDANGQASYSAWYELIPAPAISIGSMTIHAGDRMKASIAEVIPNTNIWTIELMDLTAGQSFSTTVPYASTHLTAEWITETPVVIGGGGGVQIGPMPDLSPVHFAFATTNSGPAGLKASEAIQLADPNTGEVFATPSRPRGGTRFNDCTYRTRCPAP